MSDRILKIAKNHCGVIALKDSLNEVGSAFYLGYETCLKDAIEAISKRLDARNYELEAYSKYPEMDTRTLQFLAQELRDVILILEELKGAEND